MPALVKASLHNACLALLATLGSLALVACLLLTGPQPFDAKTP